jgi:hypothetical protein
LGKTAAVKEYAFQNPDVILVEADLGYTAKVLFSELHRRLGMDGSGMLHDMFMDVVNKLKGSGRLIIIDEAEHLPYRALEMLRRIADFAEIGIVFVGMPRLIGNLRGKKGEYAQLSSRIGIAGGIGKLLPSDTQEIVNAAIPGSNGLWKKLHDVSGGNTRTLCKLIQRSIRVAAINDIPVTEEVVDNAARLLIGWRS